MKQENIRKCEMHHRSNKNVEAFLFIYATKVLTLLLTFSVTYLSPIPFHKLSTTNFAPYPKIHPLNLVNDASAVSFGKTSEMACSSFWRGG
jgi:hypothetical protein